MKLLVFSDIHGDKTALEKLMEIEADYYFAAGDLANWSRGLERAGPILQRRADKMYVLPGNHESERDVVGFCADYGFRDFHGKTGQAGRFTIRWHPRSDAPSVLCPVLKHGEVRGRNPLSLPRSHPRLALLPPRGSRLSQRRGHSRV